ncbi:MAG: hypothetical protein IJV22_03465 [Bacteroidales bacterium]|nr:hypothetical protein [Bacteroidales bacterium]
MQDLRYLFGTTCEDTPRHGRSPLSADAPVSLITNTAASHAGRSFVVFSTIHTADLSDTRVPTAQLSHWGACCC